MGRDLIPTTIEASHQPIGWAPSRLVIDFPRYIENNLILTLRISEECRELPDKDTPSNKMEIENFVFRDLLTRYNKEWESLDE